MVYGCHHLLWIFHIPFLALPICTYLSTLYADLLYRSSTNQVVEYFYDGTRQDRVYLGSHANMLAAGWSMYQLPGHSLPTVVRGIHPQSIQGGTPVSTTQVSQASAFQFSSGGFGQPSLPSQHTSSRSSSSSSTSPSQNNGSGTSQYRPAQAPTLKRPSSDDSGASYYTDSASSSPA